MTIWTFWAAILTEVGKTLAVRGDEIVSLYRMVMFSILPYPVISERECRPII